MLDYKRNMKFIVVKQGVKLEHSLPYVPSYFSCTTNDWLLYNDSIEIRNTSEAAKKHMRFQFLVPTRVWWCFLRVLGKFEYSRNCFLCLIHSLSSRDQGLILKYKIVETPVAVEFIWESKLLRLLCEYIQLENTLAWLSTLGGAYSALADEDEKFAEFARNISLKQLCLAVRLGDPFVVSRCRIYIVMSLLQKGELRRSRKLILREWEFANSPLGRSDRRLAKMCQSVWIRRKSIIEDRRARKTRIL